MKKLGIFVFAVFMLIGFSSLASAAPTLSFQIDFGQDSSFETYYEMAPGASVTADIYFSVTEQGVTGGGFLLNYDQTLMAVTSYAFVYPPFTDTGASYNNPGALGVEAFAFPPGTAAGPGQIKFITVVLECLGIGSTDLMINDFNAATSQWVTSPGGLVLDDQLANPIFLATVNQVPIPGAVWLLGSGLVGLIGLKRRKRS